MLLLVKVFKSDPLFDRNFRNTDIIVAD